MGISSTVNVEMFAQYIFSRISRSVLGAQKYDVSEKLPPIYREYTTKV